MFQVTQTNIPKSALPNKRVHDPKADLFDIDENFECSYDGDSSYVYDDGQYDEYVDNNTSGAFSYGYGNLGANIGTHYATPAYEQKYDYINPAPGLHLSYAPPLPAPGFLYHPHPQQMGLGDPFIGNLSLGRIDEREGEEYAFHDTQAHLQSQPQYAASAINEKHTYHEGDTELNKHVDDLKMAKNDAQFSPPTKCSSCAIPGTSIASLALLNPCHHALCSACLTSALNIVGEVEMRCVVCKGVVAGFGLVRADTNAREQEKDHKKAKKAKEQEEQEDMRGKSFLLPLISSDSASTSSNSSSAYPYKLDSAFEFGMGVDGQGVRASTPLGDVSNVRRGSVHVEGKKQGHNKAQEECVVLRIDNVPWAS